MVHGGAFDAVLLSSCVGGFICGVLFCDLLFLAFPSFGNLGRLCFVTVAFPGYLHLYFLFLLELLFHVKLFLKVLKH